MIRWAAVMVVLSGCVRALPEPEMEARCEEGLSRYCLDLGFVRVERLDVDGALLWFDRACAAGDDRGCQQSRRIHGTAWASWRAMEWPLALAGASCARGSAAACGLGRELMDRIETLRAQETREDASFFEEVLKQRTAAVCTDKRGLLEKEVIQEVIRRHRLDIRACYEAELWRVEPFDARVRLRWSIEGDGHVSDVEIVEDTTPIHAVATCARESVRTWRFPPTKCGGQVIITFPFLFRVVAE